MPRKAIVSFALLSILAQQTASLNLEKSSHIKAKIEKAKTTKEIRTEVMNSGYWFAMCQDVQMVWEHCKPESVLSSDSDASAQVPELDCDEGSESESETAKANRCNLKPFQNYCRNTLLKYFAFEKNNEVVFVALQESEKFRKEFHDQCRMASKSI